MTAAVERPTRRQIKQSPEKLASATVVLSIERKIPSFSRKMRAQDVVAESDTVDRTMLHISKDLLDRKLMREINRADGDARDFLESRAVTCKMLARGMWLIPVALVNEVDARVSEWIRLREALAQTLAREKYKEARESAAQRLGKHFRDEEYPSPEQLEASFGVRAKWLSFNVPAALEDLNRELYERERAKVEQEWQSAGDEIRSALRESFAGLIEHMADRLGKDDATGKPRTFRDSTVEQLQDFLKTFAARDLTGDEDLAKLARQAQGLLKGASPEDLRKKETLRDRVAEGMAAIKETLTKMDVVSPKARRFLKEEEV